MTEHFDLAIVGTGSGNSILDDRFEDWKVAIVERDVFGGTCLNRGCIPTKMLVVPADMAHAVGAARRLGVDLHLDGVRWRDLRDRVFGRIDAIAASGERYRSGQRQVSVFAGDGSFSGDKEMTVEVDGRRRTFSADRFVLAVGARAQVPEIPGLAEFGFHTSDTVMRIDELPRRMLVIGAGFIATEMTHVFSAFGTEVVMVTRGDGVLTHHDPDVSAAATAAIETRARLHRHARVRGVTGQRESALVAIEDSSGRLTKVETDLILVATGRIPNGDQLRLEATGLSLDEGGFIPTDATLETRVPGIFALGDATSSAMLKHVANHQARVVQHNLLSPASPMRVEQRFVPHAVFGEPQVAAVGLSEPEAGAAGYDVVCGYRRYGDTAYGWALDDEHSFCKLVADRATRRLLGAHIVGPHASILIQQLVQGLCSDLSVEQMARGQMYPHPALTEVVEQALLDLARKFGD
ncbi:MAG: mycothione reductase [Microthrixaceae bacterium]|nr:mycothione reductase [Microthrixaceae bacterium]